MRLPLPCWIVSSPQVLRTVGRIDLAELVFEVGLALVGGGLEGRIGRQQPPELDPFDQFCRGKLWLVHLSHSLSLRTRVVSSRLRARPGKHAKSAVRARLLHGTLPGVDAAQATLRLPIAWMQNGRLARAGTRRLSPCWCVGR